MDGEDRRRYLIVGSVYFDIVQPVFRTKLKKYFTLKELASFQDFLNTQPVKHILFHLRHRHATCCTNTSNCYNQSTNPMYTYQWNLLYTESPGQCGHNCHCKFTANQVQLNDLDITLASLILLNCCNLEPNEEHAIHMLRCYKNDFVSHNAQGAITETKYKRLWTDLTIFVLQLDLSKQDDLIRIENGPLEGLCSKYSIDLLNIHEKINEMDTSMHEMSSTVQRIDCSIQEMSPIVQGVSSLFQGMISTVQELERSMQEQLSFHRNEATCQKCKKKLSEQDRNKRKRNLLKRGRQLIKYIRHIFCNPGFRGKKCFYEHCSIDLTSFGKKFLLGFIPDVVMMDDDRLVMCLFERCSLLICNTDGSQVDSIPVEGNPCCVIAVNISTVAVTVCSPTNIQCIEMYDINKNLILKSIPIPGMVCYSGISRIDNKFVVGGVDRLLIVNYQSEEMVSGIGIQCQPFKINASGDKIFYTDSYLYKNNNLYWLSITDEIIYTLALPSKPHSIITLQDGSLHVICADESIQHVSSNGKQFKTLKAY